MIDSSVKHFVPAVLNMTCCSLYCDVGCVSHFLLRLCGLDYPTLITDFSAAAGDHTGTTSRRTADEGGVLGSGAGEYQENSVHFTSGYENIMLAH